MCCMIWEELDTHARKSAPNTFVSRFGFDSIPNNAIKETFKAQDESIHLSPAQNKQSSKCIAATVASSLTELFTCGRNNNHQSNMHQHAAESTNKCIASSSIFDLLVSADLLLIHAVHCKNHPKRIQLHNYINKWTAIVYEVPQGRLPKPAKPCKGRSHTIL